MSISGGLDGAVAWGCITPKLCSVFVFEMGVRMKWIRRLRLLAVVCAVLCSSRAAFAVSAACTSVAAGTSIAPPVFSDIMLCVFDTIGPYAQISALLVILVPLVLIVWGMRSGFSVVTALFKKAVSSVSRT